MPEYRLSDRKPNSAHAVIGNCVMCGKLIAASEIPEDGWTRQYTLKWKIHPACYEFINKKLDLEAK